MVSSDEIKKEINTSFYENIFRIIQSNKKMHEFDSDITSKQIIKYIVDEYISGNRTKNIAKELKNFYVGIDIKDLTIITQTIASITSTELIQQRSKKSNINWYLWKTSDDQRVSESHKRMQDVLVNWDNPPSPEKLINMENIGFYNAGETFECRCYPEPLVTLDFIKWPHKVYYKDKIQVMSKTQFEKIMN